MTLELPANSTVEIDDTAVDALRAEPGRGRAAVGRRRL